MARVINTMPRIIVPYSFGKCINFNQTNSSVSLVLSSNFTLSNLTSFTFAAWIFPKVIDGTARRIFDFNVNCHFGFMFVDTAPGINNGLVMSIGFSGTSAQVASGIDKIKIGEWQRVLGTWSDADTLPNIYINGIHITPATTQNPSGSRTIEPTGLTQYIGNNNNNNRAFIGLIDEFCCWNRVLTSQEISDDYYKMMKPVSTKNLMLRFPMDEESGNLKDNSENIITGTPNNVTQNIDSLSATRSTTTRSTTGTRTGI